MEVYVLREDSIEELSERTGRSIEQLRQELFDSIVKGTTVHYYFGLPKLEEE